MSGPAQGDFSMQTLEPRLEEAAAWFRRMHSESARAEDLSDFNRWLEGDSRNLAAYQEMVQTWSKLADLACAPEVLVHRRNALDSARRVARRRWFARPERSQLLLVAASLVIAVMGTLSIVYWPRGVYSTGVGEKRVLTLEDGSVLTLDARSRVQVRYDANQRRLNLEKGQARFDVARDPARPFRVQAGDQTVVALGTQFTVELVGGNVLVSMIEGRVAVTGLNPVPSAHGISRAIELQSGEGVRIRRNGVAALVPQIDVARATAWQSGKLFFDNEPLVDAVERINRYSRIHIEVGREVDDVRINGVFNAGDSNAFIEAISTYLPIRVDRTGASEIRLTSKG